MVVPETSEKSSRKPFHRIIDVDVHPRFKGGMSDIHPYLTAGWKRKLEHLASMRGDIQQPTRFIHPLGQNALMVDATAPDGSPPGSDVDFVRAQLLDHYGLDIALLVALEPAHAAVSTADPDTSAALVSAYNDFLIERWLDDPRFRLALNVTPTDPIAGAAEIRRLGGHPRVAGVFLPLINTRLGSRYFHPIYEAALEHELPIVIHPGRAEGTYVGAPLFAGGSPEFYAEWKVDWAQLGQAEVSSLILHGTFTRYPTLKVLLLEFGFSWAVPLIWRMDKTWKELRLDMPWLTKWPSEYLRENVLMATQPMDEPLLQADLDHLIESYLADSIAYASDYPHWDIDTPGTVLLTLSPETREKVFYKNAESVLRLRG